MPHKDPVVRSAYNRKNYASRADEIRAHRRARYWEETHNYYRDYKASAHGQITIALNAVRKRLAAKNELLIRLQAELEDSLDYDRAQAAQLEEDRSDPDPVEALDQGRQ